MRNLIILIFLFFSVSVELRANDLLRNAEKAYDSRKYAEAIKNYEKLVAEGYKSYQLYFNLGNSFYRNNQLGKAIYYYELARKLEPNDEDIRINLGIATSKTIDKIDAKENFFISAVKTNLLTSLTTNAWAWLSIVSLFLAVIFFFVFISSGRLLIKRIGFFMACLFVVGAVFTYFLGYSALSAKYENKFAIILQKEIRILNEPTALAKTKFNLHEGTRIRVVDTNGDWVLIKLDNGNEGWVKLAEIGII